MNLKIPFLTTRIETDLALTLVLTPVWWFSGCIIFIYPLIAALAFSKLLVISIYSGEPLRIPKSVTVFVVFLLFYLFSILLNAANLPIQRVFASFNNYSLLIMGLLLILLAYHCDAEILLKEFFKAGKVLSVLTSLLGVFFLLMWLKGHRELQWISFLGKKMSFLLNYPYFNSLLLITGTDFDIFSDIEFPRLAIYSQAPTSTGGLMVVLVPLLMGYYALSSKRKISYPFFFFLGLLTLGFSISRAAIYAFFGAFLFVEILSRGKKMAAAFGGLFIGLLASGVISQAASWVFNIRKSSNVGRLEVYEEALRIVREENLWMGVGARLRDEFTMRAVGSHGLYIEILFVTGLIGLSLFVLFQALVVRNWYSQKRYLKKDSEKKIWKFLGMSLLGTNIWLLTDTIFGLPTIAYAYFFLTGIVLLTGMILKDRGISENFTLS